MIPNLGSNSIDVQMKLQMQQSENELQKLKSDFLNPKGKDEKRLKKTAQEFEAIFFKQIIEQMDKTVERGDFLNGGPSEEIFRNMMFDEVSKRLCSRPGGSGLGLAETIYRQMAQNLVSDTTETSSINTQTKESTP